MKLKRKKKSNEFCGLISIFNKNIQVQICYCGLYIYIYIYMWGHRAQGYTSTFCTGYKAHAEAIVVYEEDSSDHGNPGSHAEDNPILG